MPGDSRFKLDPNSRGGGVVGGYSSADAIGADNPTLIVLRLDPTTGRLLVDSNTGGTPVQDGEAVSASDYGTLLLGTDGSNYQVVSVNSSGRLQVDVISGGGGGTQYTEGDTDASITGTAMLMEVAANTLQPVQGTVADGLLVNLGTNNDVVVSAADLDIRNLTSTDVVTVTGGAGQTADVKITLDSESVAVTGTFWQATQPVSIAQDVMLGTDFSDVLGTASLILATQADDVVNTSDGLQTSSFLYVYDGATWDRLRGDSTNGMLVNLGSNNDVVVTNAGTFAVQDSQDVMLGTDFSNVFGTGSLLITTQADNVANTQDTIATSALLYAFDGSTWDRMLGNSTDGLLVNLGSNNDVGINAGTNAIGKLLPPDIDTNGSHANLARKYYTNAGPVTDGIVWSPAAGKRWHLLWLYIQVSAASTVTLEDDLGAGDSAFFKSEFAANGGVFLVFPEKYPLASAEDAADLLITTTAGNVYVTCGGYEV